MTTATLQAHLATIPDAVNAGPRTVAALPPSDLDPSAGLMRVRTGGTEITRAYDPVLEQP